MQDLEKSKEQVRSHIAELTNHIIKLNKQKLDAETMEESLVRFSQIVEVATSEEKKSLIPRIIDSIIYKPGEIKIALFDRPVERGLCKIGDAVNPNGDYAFSGINWLRKDLCIRLYRRFSMSKLTQPRIYQKIPFGAMNFLP